MKTTDQAPSIWKSSESTNQNVKIRQMQQGFLDVFMRDGYSGASVDDIANAAKVSKATLYKYYPDKSFMFVDMIKVAIWQSFSVNVFEHVKIQSPQTTLPKLLYKLALWSASEPRLGLLRIVISEALRFPAGAQDYASALTRNVTEPLKSIIDKWIVTEEIEHHDIDASAVQLITSVMAQAQQPILLGICDKFDTRLMNISTDASSMFLSKYGK